MAFTFDEKLEKLKNARSAALNQLIAIAITKASALEEDQFNDTFLFGDGGEIGIVKLIDYYYIEKIELNADTYADSPGVTIGNPSVAGDWTPEFDASLDGTTSDPDPYYDDTADQNLNTDTTWLNDNSAATGGSAGAIFNCNELVVGTNGINDLQTERGSNPDNFPTAMRTAILTFLLALIQKIDASSTYQTLLNTLSSEVSDIKDGTNTLFETSGMDDSVDDDTAAITALLAVLVDAGVVGDSNDLSDTNDVGNDDTLYAYYNYFEGFTPGDPPTGQTYVQATFDTYLQELETLANTTIKGALNTRYGNIEGIIGGEDPSFTKLRQWRYFWINQKIGKPLGSRVTYLAMGTAEISADKALDEANDGLAAVIGNNYDEYIPTPKIIAAYYNPLINKSTGLLILQRDGLVLGGQSHATSYEIYRRVTSDDDITNDEWGDDVYLTHTEVDDETGNISLIVDDEEVDEDTTYTYRVVTVDDTNDAFASESIESDIYDETSSISFTGIVNNSIVFTDPHELKKRQFALIKMDVPDSDIDGYHRIVNADENTITFFENLSTVLSGKVYPISTVATTEAPVIVLPAAGGTSTVGTIAPSSSSIFIKHEWDGTYVRLFDIDGVPGPYVNLVGPAGPAGSPGSSGASNVTTGPTFPGTPSLGDEHWNTTLDEWGKWNGIEWIGI